MAKKNEKITFNKKTIDILAANITPTTKYFETRFDFMQHQMDKTNNEIKKLEENMKRRFQQLEEEFEQVEMDKKCEKIRRDIRDIKDSVDKLSQMVSELTIDVKTSVQDYIIELNRKWYDTKFNNLRMIMIAILVGIGILFLS